MSDLGRSSKVIRIPKEVKRNDTACGGDDHPHDDECEHRDGGDGEEVFDSEIHEGEEELRARNVK